MEPEEEVPFDIPVFDAIAKKVNVPEPEVEEIISAAELLENNDMPEAEALGGAELFDAPAEEAEPVKEAPVKKVERLSAEQEADLRGQLDENMKAIPIPYKFPPATLLAPERAKRARIRARSCVKQRSSLSKRSKASAWR